MNKYFVVLATLLSSAMMSAEVTLDYTTFFRAEAVGSNGVLEKYVYTNTDGSDPMQANQWNGSGKSGLHEGASSTVSASTLTYTDANGKEYVDNGKGLMIESGWHTFVSGTGHDDIFSLVNDQNTYTGKAYYAAFLLRVDSCKSTDGNDIFAFDGNAFANAQRGRVFAKKGTASKTFALGIAYNQANDAKGTNPVVSTCPNYAYGATVLVVAKITPNKSAGDQETFALYVNPLLDSNEADNTPVDQGGIEGATSYMKAVKGLTVRQRANIAYHLAGLRFTDSWAEAVKAAKSGDGPDPEPEVPGMLIEEGFDTNSNWTVVRGGSSTNQNHGLYGTIARSMSFAKTETSDKCTDAYLESPAVKGAGVLRFWVMGSSNVTQASIRVDKCRPNDTTELAYYPGTFSKTWTEYTVIVNDTNTCAIRLTTNGCNVGTGTLYIDDISLSYFAGGAKPRVDSTWAEPALNKIHARVTAGEATDRIETVELLWGYSAANLYRKNPMTLSGTDYAATIQPLGNGREVFYQVVVTNQNYVTDTSAVQSYITPAPVDNSPVVFSVKPHEMQLYPRNTETNQATVRLVGRMNREEMNTVYLRCYRDSVLQRVDTVQTAAFEQTYTLTAGLTEYLFTYATNLDATEMVIANHVVAGDVLVLTGQSNAAATVPGNPRDLYPNGEKQVSSNWWRNYGCVQKDNPYNPADTTWGLSNSAGWSYGKQYCNGYGAYVLHRTLEMEQQLPTAILNYAVGGSTIAQNLPNEQDHEDIDTYYGRGLYRARHAGVAEAVRALIWIQGEADQNGVYAKYADQFDRLYQAWTTDYPNLERIYVSQINVGCGTGAYASELREVQRRFFDTYKDASVPVTVVTNIGIPVRYDSCHYEVEGYERLYGQYAAILQQDLYGRNYERPLGSPMIRRVERGDHRLTLVFDQPMVWPEPMWNRDMKDFFFDENDQQIPVVRGYVDSAKPEQVVLETQEIVTAEALTYGPDSRAWSETRGRDTIYVDPWLRNPYGFAALTFNRYPISEPTATAVEAVRYEPAAIKYLQKGEMVILRGRKRYNVLGAAL